MPPSVELTASAWESLGPGLCGSLIGNAAAGALVDAGAGADAVPVLMPVPSAGVARVLGAWSETMTTDRSSFPRPFTTKIAGRSLVGPPCGMSAIARWRPGASWTGAGAGRTATWGARTVWTAEASVPRSVARTGRYWPDGHHAQASRA